VKTVLLLVLLVLGGWGGITRIRDRNAAVQQAAAAYTRQDFVTAAQAYQKAVEELGATDEATILNLAHACTRAGQSDAAKAYYGQLLSSKTASLRSVAQQQLGVLAVQKGEFAQAVGLLRLALLADPTNAEARYNYEVLRDYLARRPDTPRIPPPAESGSSSNSKHSAPKPQESSKKAQSRAGNDRSGEREDPNLPPDPKNAPQARPDEAGRPDANRSGAAPGNTARGGLRPGAGAERAMSSGTEPGAVRGLSSGDGGEEITDGTGRRAGTETATPDETQLQTQRARLQQMQLSPGRARQILESLGAAEQQYLQQLPRRAARKPASDKPAW
jgi:tetratricopeptide (TPR) repeat protein